MSSNTQADSDFIEKIRSLPPGKLAEVENFVDDEEASGNGRQLGGLQRPATGCRRRGRRQPFRMPSGFGELILEGQNEIFTAARNILGSWRVWIFP